MSKIYNKAIMMVVMAIVITLFSCHQSERSKMDKVFKEWTGKEIIFPGSSVFTVYVSDTATVNVSDAAFKIVTYVDLSECTSCELNLISWKQYISGLKIMTKGKVPVLFYIHTKDLMGLRYALRRDAFDYPICIDTADTFNKLNKLEKDRRFQTFLINKNNRVIAVGNPSMNLQIRQLYYSIFADPRFSLPSQQKKELVMPASIELGEFDWDKTIKKSFEIKNNSKGKIHLTNISSSCECLKIGIFEMTIMPKSNNKLVFTFKAERAEGSFYREITMLDQFGREYVVNVTGISD